MTSILERSIRELLKEVLAEVVHEARSPSFTVEGLPNEPLLLRPKEAAESLGISEGTLKNLTRAGSLPTVRIGRLVRYDPNALREWIRLPDTARVLQRQTGGGKSQPKQDERAKSKTSRKQSKAATKSQSRPKPAKASKARTQRSPAAKRSHKGKDTSASTGPGLRDVRQFFADRMGVSRDDMPSKLTNGDLMRAAEVDIATMHGWIYLGRDLPPEAIDKLEAYFSASLEKGQE